MALVEGITFGHKRLIQNIVNTHWQADAEKKIYNYNELLFVLDSLLRDEGKSYMEGKYSLQQGYQNFKMFVAHLLYRNIANYDSMVLLTGEKGTGKSSAGMMICREWCKLLGIKFNPARHIAYNNADVSAKIDLLNKFEPILCDEAIRFACVTGDTKIKTTKGIYKIKDLVGEENFEVFSFNEKTQKEEIQIANKCIQTKTDYIYEVQTEDGEKIKTTKEHKFLTRTGWKELQELKEGDEIFAI